MHRELAVALQEKRHRRIADFFPDKFARTVEQIIQVRRADYRLVKIRRETYRIQALYKAALRRDKVVAQNIHLLRLTLPLLIELAHHPPKPFLSQFIVHKTLFKNRL
jgi:hypothetical protein